MPYFPQLSSGCLAQFPLQKRWSARTLRNLCLDGRQVKHSDSGARESGWELWYSGLTLAEAASLQALFAECEGRLRPFVFFHPAGNLLARSEEFNVAPWQSSPMLQWATGVNDPVGTQRAMRVTNSGGVAGSAAQSVDIPANYQTCFSVYARGTSPVTIAFRRSTGAGSSSEPVSLETSWKRIEMSGRASGSNGPVIFALDLPAGTVVELWGAQLEGQLQSSAYRRTWAQSGARANARFDQDELIVTAIGIDNYATRLRVLNREEA